MADLAVSSARNAVDSLLGQLTSTLTDEVQLLGGVRRDVQFIKDEMESMNGFLMHVTEASSDGGGQEDHQVRAWMKQVGEVAYSSQNCVDLYVRSFGQGAGAAEGGFLGFLRRLPRLVWTLPTRHRIATQIRELKVRAQEVGERRLRYGVQAPPPRSKVPHEQQLWQAIKDDYPVHNRLRQNLAKSKPGPFASEVLQDWMTRKDPVLQRLGDADEKAEDSSHGVARLKRKQRSRLLIASKAHEDHLPHETGQPASTAQEDTLPHETAHPASTAPEDHLQQKTAHPASMAHEDPLPQEIDHSASTAHEDPLPHETAHSASTAHEDPLPHETAHSATTTHEEDPVPPKVASDKGTDREHNKYARIRQIAVMQFSDSDTDKWDYSVSIIKRGFDDPQFASSCSLDYKAWIILQPDENPSLSWLLKEILANLAAPGGSQLDGMDEWDNEQPLEKLQLHLKGKKFLIVLEGMNDTSLLDGIRHALPDRNCSPGSALIVITNSKQVTNSFALHNIYELSEFPDAEKDHITNFYMDKAVSLVNNPETEHHLEPVLRDIIGRLQVFSSNYVEFFITALYANPNQTIENYQSLSYSLQQFQMESYKYHVLMFAYNGLSSNCKKCLLHLSSFPVATTFRRTRLVRRWVAERMILETGRMSALEEADNCLDVLLAHKLVMPMDNIDGRSKVKKFTMDSMVHQFVTKVARNENFFETNILPVWAHRLPIGNTIALQQAAQKLHATRSKACCSMPINSNRSYQAEMDDDKLFVESLSLTTQLGHMVVLDLERCLQLRNRHLKKICTHLYNLKFLSLRSTNISKLPKQVNKLRYLETLDIRETMIKAFSRNSLILPKLKHLLAGDKGKRTWDIFGVQMPKQISTMLEVQVLSHVVVSGRGDELIQIGNLLHLRKLGVILNECQEPIFRHLYHVIGKLSECLRSLSIRKTSGNSNGYLSQDLYLAPQHLQVLKISGLEGLPGWIQNLHNLSHITLHKTLLSASDIEILGRLRGLRYLRLREKSCSESTLTFSNGIHSFMHLECLAIMCSDSGSLDITNVSFASSSVHFLKKIVWWSAGSQPLSVSGIETLAYLRELDLRGNFNLEEVNKAIAAKENKPRLSIQSSNLFDD